MRSSERSEPIVVRACTVIFKRDTVLSVASAQQVGNDSNGVKIRSAAGIVRVHIKYENYEK